MVFIKLKEIFEVIPFIIIIIILSRPIIKRFFPPFAIILIWYMFIILFFIPAVSTAIERLEHITLSFRLFIVMSLVYLFYSYKKDGEKNIFVYISKIVREYIYELTVDYKGEKKKGLYKILVTIDILLGITTVTVLFVSIINIFISIFYDIKNNNFSLFELELSSNIMESWALLIIFIIIAVFYLLGVADSIIYYKDKVKNRKVLNLLKEFIHIFEISLQQCKDAEEKNDLIKLLFEQNCIPDVDLNNKVRSIYTSQNSANFIEKAEGAIGELLMYISCELGDRDLFNEFYKICLQNEINIKNILTHINGKIIQRKEVDILGIDIIDNFLESKDKILNRFLS